MDKTTYRILARHFSEKSNIKIVFEKGACPATDGENIILPTELSEQAINPTLGALLHETGHIKKTGFSSMDYLTKPEAETLNVLEDIRIDNLTRQQYPHAIDLQKTLIDHVIKTRGSELGKETLPRQVLKGLILTSYGYNIINLYSEETINLIKELNRYIDIAVNAKLTKELIEPAKKLTALLIGEMVNQFTKNGNDTKELKEYKELKKEMVKFLKDKDEKQKKINKIGKEYNEQYKEYKKSRRITSLNNTKAYKARGKVIEGEIAQEKANKQIEKAEKLRKNHREIIAKINKTKDNHITERRLLAEEERSNKGKLSKTKNKEKELYSNNGSEPCSLIGFKAIDKELLKVDARPDIDTKKSLEGIIREALIAKKEVYEADIDGNKLNDNRLSDIYNSSDIEDLFLTQEKKEYKTKISFLVDGSISMNREGKKDLAIDSVKTIANALQLAINEDAPAEFNIYTFGTDVVKLVDNSKQYKGDDLNLQYRKGNIEIECGTYLLKAVNIVSEELRGDGEEGDKVAIVITDAKIYEHDLKELINQANDSDIRFIFISIKADLCNEERKYLFGDRNIETREEAIEIIQRAILND